MADILKDLDEEMNREGPSNILLDAKDEIERLRAVKVAAKALMDDLAATRPSFADGALMRNLADALKSAK